MWDEVVSYRRCTRRAADILFESLVVKIDFIIADKPRGKGRPVKEDFGEKRPPREGGNRDRDNAPRERRDKVDRQERGERPERFGDRFGEKTDRPQNEFR